MSVRQVKKQSTSSTRPSECIEASKVCSYSITSSVRGPGDQKGDSLSKVNSDMQPRKEETFQVALRVKTPVERLAEQESALEVLSNSRIARLRESRCSLDSGVAPGLHIPNDRLGTSTVRSVTIRTMLGL